MRKKVILVLNILIVLFTVIGVIIMLSNSGGGMLHSKGWVNLKYFTVLSNIFCGIVAAIYLVSAILNRKTGGGAYPESFPGKRMMVLKLMAATAVAVTFLMIAAFFGPLYGWLQLYRGSNLWFHLIIPVVAIVEYVLLEGELEFVLTFAAAAPALVYGIVYLANNLINGTGEWPDTNDWYGFLNWGLGVGLIIFACVAAVSWGIACGLRAINKRLH